jgi:transcriptional regulator with XRE-family HTH domain
MNKPLTKPELAALSSLIEATGLTYTALAKQLDVDPLTLSRWANGERPPNHPGMLMKALQLIVLEQRGIITDKLIEHASRAR